jgi:hypothetical protein
MIGISFVVSTDWTVRFVVMFPAMMLAVAVGIRYPLEFLWPSRIPRRYLYALMSAIIALVAGAQLTHYFGDHLTYYNQQIRQDTFDFYDVFDRAATYAREGNLYYLSDEIIFRPVLDSMQVFQNLNLEYKIWRRCEVTAANLEALPRDRPLLFAVVPTDSAMIRLLHEVFELEGPLWSRYESVPVESQYALYIYKPDTREVGADLSHSPAHVLRGEHLRPKRF